MYTLSSGRVRFGAFELDLSTGELRSTETPDPNKVLLREQVFQVLRMLLERGGKIVPRDEIKGRLWPADTIVDFDHSINAMINALERRILLGMVRQRGSGLNHGPPEDEDHPACGLMCAAHRHHFTEQWFDSLRCGRWWYVAHLFASRSWAERGTKCLLTPALFRDQGRFSCTEHYGCSPKLQVARALRSACS
jgi:hypothetical protein